MTDTGTIHRVAIVGTGVIGASWTALFLSKGLHVVATDTAPNTDEIVGGQEHRKKRRFGREVYHIVRSVKNIGART